MLCKNTGSEEAKFSIDGPPGMPARNYVVKPGATVDIPEGYCRTYKAPTGRTRPAIVTQLHQDMRPIEDATSSVAAPAAAAPTGDLAAIVASLSSLRSDLTALTEENKALRRENKTLRKGKATDSDEPDANGIATSPKANG